MALVLPLEVSASTLAEDDDSDVCGEVWVTVGATVEATVGMAAGVTVGVVGFTVFLLLSSNTGVGGGVDLAAGTMGAVFGVATGAGVFSLAGNCARARSASVFGLTFATVAAILVGAGVGVTVIGAGVVLLARLLFSVSSVLCLSIWCKIS